MRFIVAFAALCAGLFLAACSGHGDYTPPVFQGEITLVAQEVPPDDVIIPLSLKIQVADYELAKHEPPHGTFIGMYIARDTTAISITAFENAIGINHALFAYTMALGDNYPLLWVLECLSAQKIPFITVLPPENGYLYDVELLHELALSAGRFNVPLFIHLYPIKVGHNFSPPEHISFFRTAHTIFAQYAPNVALVWGFDTEKLGVSAYFYPGGDVADWIHMTIYNNISIDGTFRDFFAYIDFFYYMYQHKAPLAISTAVSHYTIETNTYFTRTAADKILHIYEGLQEYPRIRAVLYRNYSDLAGSGNKYVINTTDVIRAAYVRAVSDSHFINLAPKSSVREQQMSTKQLRSLFRAMMRDSYFYIPLRALIYDICFPYLEHLEGMETIINGEIFFSMADINGVSGMDFFVDLERRVLVLK